MCMGKWAGLAQEELQIKRDIWPQLMFSDEVFLTVSVYSG